ncbi:MAG: hypothetical protein DRI90_26640 [Deltaproteobacteria bacterium]|nr:MAG: hypothetical protein DRI90_26640 [Deltaproteobacteria bacterium]
MARRIGVGTTSGRRLRAALTAISAGAPGRPSAHTPTPTLTIAGPAAAVHPECRERCSVDGRCSDVDGDCVATSDARCRACRKCLESSRCFQSDGRRKAGSEADCRASRACREDGDGFCDAENLHCDDGMGRNSKPLSASLSWSF